VLRCFSGACIGHVFEVGEGLPELEISAYRDKLMLHAFEGLAVLASRAALVV